jgi:hypothetical protein
MAVDSHCVRFDNGLGLFVFSITLEGLELTQEKPAGTAHPISCQVCQESILSNGMYEIHGCEELAYCLTSSGGLQRR